MSATPYRKDFYGKLVSDPKDIPQLQEAMKTWLAALEERVSILKQFQETKEAKW